MDGLRKIRGGADEPAEEEDDVVDEEEDEEGLCVRAAFKGLGGKGIRAEPSRRAGGHERLEPVVPGQARLREDHELEGLTRSAGSLVIGATMR